MFAETFLIITIAFFIIRCYKQYTHYRDDKYYKTLSNIKGVTYCETPHKHIKLSSSRICHKIYTSKMNVPKDLCLGDLFNRWLGRCMGNLNIQDPAWNNLKKIFIILFNSKNDDLRKTAILDWEKNIQCLYKKTKNNNISFFLNDVIDDLPLKYITYLIFGKTFYDKNKNIFTSLQTYANILMRDILQGTGKHYSHRFAFSVTNTALNNFDMLWAGIMKNALDDVNVQTEGIYKQLYSNYVNHSKFVTYEMFSQTLIEIIYANQDVVTPSFAWVLVNYANNHKILDNTENFIEESARMCPIFPTSMPKILATDVMMDGIVIKKNTVVCIDFVGLGNNSDEWDTDDLDKFRPNRFANSSTHKLINRFGYGGRKCPGSKLANLLFVDAINMIRNKWIFVPMCPYSKVELDLSKPFITPQMNLWITELSHNITNDNLLHFNCNPYAKYKNTGFFVVSVNEKSPYLMQTNCDLLIQYIVENILGIGVIVLADEISHYNIQAFDRYNETKSKEKAHELGNKLFETFSKSIRQFTDGTIKLYR